MIEANLGEIAIVFSTKLGWMAARFCGDSVTRTTFGHRLPGQAIKAIGRADVAKPLSPYQRDVANRLKQFAAGEATYFDDVSVTLRDLTKFQRSVLNHTRTLGWGETASYSSVARCVGRPGAARAVGNAMAKNPVPLIIPCHRVVSSNGLGGFSALGGARTKQTLLDAELS